MALWSGAGPQLTKKVVADLRGQSLSARDADEGGRQEILTTGHQTASLQATP